MNGILVITSSIDRGTRLNGSLLSDKRCDLIVDLSMVTLEDGRMTGSRMSVNMSGSMGRRLAILSVV